jgi:acetyl esterase/lipase
MRLGVIVLAALLGAGCVPAGPPPRFYDYVGPRLSGTHGAMIRYEPLAGPPKGSRAYRVLYQSTGMDGRPIPVSAMVVIPDKPAPPGGRPVIAWAHPTTGVQPQCGPSLSTLRFLMIAGLEDMLNAGFVVTATDYPGLGTGVVHPFLDGTSEGHAVLDSVRAVAAIPGASTNSQFALWGHSQGGQAVLFAAKLARSYTPELLLTGAAAAAPATNLAQLFRDDLGTTGGNNLAAMTLWSWSKVYGASYEKVVAPTAIPAVATVAGNCIDTIFETSAKKQADVTLSQAYFTVPDITVVEPWRSIIERNTPGPIPQTPLFLSQGTADTTVRPTVTYNFAKRQCAAGGSVTLDVIPGVSHDWIAMKSAGTAVTWIRERMKGVPAPNNCSDIDGIVAAANATR